MLTRLLLVLACALAAAGTPFSSLYFFGDSLTDSGNVYKATTVLNRYTLGGIPRHPAAPYVGGAFTNGPVWAEHTAARLGMAQDAEPAGMSMGWFGQVGGDGGNNYAVGGARTDSGGALGLLNYALPTGMFEQVDFYLGSTGGAADPNGLYFILGGGNDIRDAARLPDHGQRVRAAEQAGANIAYSVRDLYWAGARQFVLINLPDVGLIPETLGDGLSAQGTDASVAFNNYLGLYADYLRSVPEFSLEYFDLFGLHHELVNQYGLGAVRGCKGGPPGSCDGALFFDSIHPSAWVHEIIGNRIADQISGTSSNSFALSAAEVAETPEPSTIALAGFGIGLVVFLRRRSG